MARISVFPNILPAIGKTIGEAAMDPAKRSALEKDPAAALKSAGVAESDLDGFRLEIVNDSAKVVHLVIPFGVDTNRIKSNDQEYLELLGTIAVLGCIAPAISVPDHPSLPQKAAKRG